MDRLMQAPRPAGEILRPADCRFWLQRAVGDGRPHPDAPRERLMTIMMAPFMSCGARKLAIFRLRGRLFGQNGALAVFSLYVLGIVMAILTGLMLKHTIMRAAKLAVRDGAAGVPRPAYQEPDYPDLAAPERSLCCAPGR